MNLNNEKGDLIMCFFKKRRERKRALEREKKEQALKVVEEVKVVEPQPSQDKTTPVEVKEPKPVEVKTEVKAEEKVEVKAEKPANDTPKAEKAAKYHVSQNKDEDSENFKKWRVRKEGSTKTIKFFDTQKEAIAFAEDLAEKAGSSIVIHKVDGSIRKQDYAKKA